ncbi:kinase-like protein [Gigaspora margarita]|uniref:non-specific serine/threonine protein kinase n=1 Tax=Gigaspora margarita TaxID=4874 RepID=A0A8H4AX91_GIGMA|nr:kinase-like protein [Gigaspora margarita]
MTNIPEEWLEKAIRDGHINYLEYNKFTDPVVIGVGVLERFLNTSGKTLNYQLLLNALESTNIILLRKVSNHLNIIGFYGVTKDSGGYYNLVLQYADNGTLREYLKTNFTRLHWTEKLRIAKEIELGLLFLHDHNIIHRDLHLKNILIHQRIAKITDFGLSKQINETSITSNSIFHGMPAYIEPQCFINQGYKRDKRSDIYSFGKMLG